MQQQLESNERKPAENTSSNAKGGGETCDIYREGVRILVGIEEVRLLLCHVLMWKAVSMGEYFCPVAHRFKKSRLSIQLPNLTIPPPSYLQYRDHLTLNSRNNLNL